MNWKRLAIALVASITVHALVDVSFPGLSDLWRGRMQGMLGLAAVWFILDVEVGAKRG